MKSTRRANSNKVIQQQFQLLFTTQTWTHLASILFLQVIFTLLFHTFQNGGSHYYYDDGLSNQNLEFVYRLLTADGAVFVTYLYTVMLTVGLAGQKIEGFQYLFVANRWTQFASTAAYAVVMTLIFSLLGLMWVMITPFLGFLISSSTIFMMPFWTEEPGFYFLLWVRLWSYLLLLASLSYLTVTLFRFSKFFILVSILVLTLTAYFFGSELIKSSLFIVLDNQSTWGQFLRAIVIVLFSFALSYLARSRMEVFRK